MKIEKTPLNVIFKKITVWRVYWIGRYSKTTNHFDLYEEKSAYKIMSFFLKKETCSWISSIEKSILISNNHPMWHPYEENGE